MLRRGRLLAFLQVLGLFVTLPTAGRQPSAGSQVEGTRVSQRSGRRYLGHEWPSVAEESDVELEQLIDLSWGRRVMAARGREGGKGWVRRATSTW